jgi:hypothetical protein
MMPQSRPLPPLSPRGVPPAPHMTADEKCSDCKKSFIWAGGRDYKICPQCCAVLWHRDVDAEARAIRAEMAAKQKALMAQAHKERMELKARKVNRSMTAVGLTVSSPILGEPDDK